MKFKKYLKIANLGMKTLICFWIAIHAIFAAHAMATSKTLEDRVYVINERWQYKVLSPLDSESLGITLPYIGVSYANKENILGAGVTIEGIKKHEAKHISQYWDLGFKYFSVETWKLEGVADYARGGPTESLCSPSQAGNEIRLKYREYFIMAKYLIEAKGLSESEVYEYDGYPLESAVTWLHQNECKNA